MVTVHLSKTVAMGERCGFLNRSKKNVHARLWRVFKSKVAVNASSTTHMAKRADILEIKIGWKTYRDLRRNCKGNTGCKGRIEEGNGSSLHQRRAVGRPRPGSSTAQGEQRDRNWNVRLEEADDTLTFNESSKDLWSHWLALRNANPGGVRGIRLLLRRRHLDSTGIGC